MKKPNPIPMTREGLEKAKADYGEFATKREGILLRLQAAREMGDLSENGAYTAAKFELSTCDREMRRLQLLVKYGVVKEKTNGFRIDFGSVVTLQKENKKITFTLVSGYESDPGKSMLSTSSPFGKAVLDKQLGDKVIVVAPAGLIEYKITDVK